MKKVFTKTLVALCCFALSLTAMAQEPELVNEIVARINNDIITRADYMGALEELKASLVKRLQQEGKGEAEINAEYEKIKPTVLDLLIDNILLEQRAKELGIDVEAEVNQYILQLVTEYQMPTVLELEKAMRQQGVDPEAFRASIRRQFQQEQVIGREVMSPIFQSLTEKDKREFYEKNKSRFTKPGESTISEIFLPLEGYTAAEVEQRARRIIEELRAGLSFTDAVQKYSPASRPTRAQGGKMGTFKQGEVRSDIEKAISTLKVGDVTEPLRIQEGYQIIRLDAQTPATVMPYEDQQVQNFIGRAATMERSEDARKKFLKRLRDEAYIKITKGYDATQAAK